MKQIPDYKDDLDYLSELGFEQVATDSSDLKDLNKRIRRRTFSLKNFYLMLGSLLIGILIGFVIFFELNDSEKNYPENKKPLSSISSDARVKGEPVKVITLDTISIAKENFIKPTLSESTKNSKNESPVETESPDQIISKPVDLSILGTHELKEAKLKYMINAPVFYLHDMKITSYTTLYFEKNRFVRFSGISADNSSTVQNNATASHLKESADYYLHEEIANAMLQFKKEHYDETIYILRNVASYNNDKDLNCDFYMAMSYYYKKNFSKAIPLFDECIYNANNTFLQEAMFYKATSLFENGNKEEAKKLFEKIADEGEFYASKAHVILQDFAKH